MQEYDLAILDEYARAGSNCKILIDFFRRLTVCLPDRMVLVYQGVNATTQLAELLVFSACCHSLKL